MLLLIGVDLPWLLLGSKTSKAMIQSIQGSELSVRYFPSLLVYVALAYLIQLPKSTLQAFLLGLKRDIPNANIINLMNESNEAYYWLGFIMADGHFNKNKQLQINLAKKDLNHLKKFARFIEFKGELKKPKISVGYTKINDWLIKNFNVTNNKTYNPCDLNNLTGDNLFSVCIGFIDGDGCISHNGVLRIKCHKSWLSNINKIASFLTNGDYKEGKIDGLCQSWYNNGNKWGKYTYKEGKLNGLYREWYDNGNKELECNYKEDERHYRVEGERVEVYKFSLTRPALIRNDVAHDVIRTNATGTRIIASWGCAGTFESCKDAFKAGLEKS